MSPVAALVVPSAAMLLTEYVGREDPAGPIRERCVRELAAMTGGGDCDEVVIVTGAERAPRHHLGPLGVRIGRQLLASAGWAGPVDSIALAADCGGEEVAREVHGIRARGGRTLLLVVADGTAKRTEKAPGHLDDRAAAVDAALVRALAEGDSAALRALDPALCQDLWLTGRGAFVVLGTAMATPLEAADVLWSDDPYGVQYVLARWRTAPPTSGAGIGHLDARSNGPVGDADA